MTNDLVDFFQRHDSIFVLTGAGLSTASGIPDYRDERGEWKHQKPMEYRDFVDSHAARQRYWARSFVGWQRFREAAPNRAHRSLARLERSAGIDCVITQNVDGLQQRAGSEKVVELHGSLDRVECLDCGAVSRRESLQQRLLAANPILAQMSASALPDGDALLRDFDYAEVRVPACKACGGRLKPHVVFFGESVPAPVVAGCYAALDRADAVLVVGSSLMVFSGFRFVRAAAERGLPIAAINRGKTRADDILSLKLQSDCGHALADIADKIEQNQTLTT